jgi:hypothetical protein
VSTISIRSIQGDLYAGEDFLYELKAVLGRLQRRPALSGQTARSVDGRAEPLGQLAEQLWTDNLLTKRHRRPP